MGQIRSKSYCDTVDFKINTLVFMLGYKLVSHSLIFIFISKCMS